MHVNIDDISLGYNLKTAFSFVLKPIHVILINIINCCVLLFLVRGVLFVDISVQEAMNIYPLSEGKVVAGAGGISRMISALNLMDAPDIYNWMKQGELLLTTGYAIKDSSELFVELLHNLNERGSSGLGIKLGRYWKQIPKIVIEEADRLDFPID
jgi:hypothetical protein